MANRPETSMKITEYDQLDEYVDAFKKGYFNLFILIGKPGLQKSYALRQAVGEHACWLEGNVTPFNMYCTLYDYRDQAVVLDDVDSFLSDKNGVRLLKCLCQTDPRKSVAWHSSASLLEKKRIPNVFTTTSQVAIIANDWSTLNDNVLAVEDRGQVVHFDPSPLEIHRRTAQWFRDQEIFDYIGEHLHLIEQHSMRLYHKALELKDAGLDWKKSILNCFLTGTALMVASLKANDAYLNEGDRVREFMRKEGGGRSTYFYHAQRLPKPETAPKILLKNRKTKKKSNSLIDRLQNLGNWGEG